MLKRKYYSEEDPKIKKKRAGLKNGNIMEHSN